MKGVRSFHVSLLKSAQGVEETTPPPPVLVQGEPEYEIEKILDVKGRGSSLRYLVHWKGYGVEERQWIPAGDIHAPKLVREFHMSRDVATCSETTPQGGGTVSNRASGRTPSRAVSSRVPASQPATRPALRPGDHPHTPSRPAASTQPQHGVSAPPRERTSSVHNIISHRRAGPRRRIRYTLRRRVH